MCNILTGRLTAEKILPHPLFAQREVYIRNLKLCSSQSHTVCLNSLGAEWPRGIFFFPPGVSPGVGGTGGKDEISQYNLEPAERTAALLNLTANMLYLENSTQSQYSEVRKLASWWGSFFFLPPPKHSPPPSNSLIWMFTLIQAFLTLSPSDISSSAGIPHLQCFDFL